MKRREKQTIVKFTKKWNYILEDKNTWLHYEIILNLNAESHS